MRQYVAPTTPARPSRARAILALGVAYACLGALALVIGAVPAAWVGHRATEAIDWWDSIEVDLDELPDTLPGHVTVVDADGKRFARFYSENRVPVASLDKIAPDLIDAVLAVEDDRFYEHGPIDIKGTGRALLSNQTEGTNQGGSTITQQYVKNLRVAGAEDAVEVAEATEASLSRKIIELKWAAELEKVKSKDEILLGYLNVAYFGNGAYGVGAAARYYFGVKASELDLGQAALLAGLLKNPHGYDPVAFPDKALGRRATVLSRMVATGRATEEEVAKVGDDLGLDITPLPNGCTVSKYPYYCSWVRMVLLEDEAFGKDAAERERNLYQGGFTVHTALDRDVQAKVQAAVDAAFSPDNRAAAAAAVVVPGTGRVPGFAQTRTWEQTQFSYPTQAMVQPGSTFKPITLAAGLEAGFAPGATLGTSTPYIPRGLNSPKGGFKNVDGRDRGAVNASEAMKYSVNTWFVRLTEKVGTQAVADMAYRLGMTSMDPSVRTVGKADGSITLGAFETTPLQMANVYATLAADGVRCRPLPIVKVTDTATGDELASPDPECVQAVDTAIAAHVGAAMTSTFDEGGTAEGLDIGRPAVGKTGTTNAHGATWFAGYTPQYATAVWVGDPRGQSYALRDVVAYGKRHAQLYGGTVAGPIWNDVMTALHKGLAKKKLTRPGPIITSGRAIPDVTGLDVRAAVATLQAAGLSVTISTETRDLEHAPAGTVAAQNPAGGSVPLDDKVELTLSTGSDTSVLVSGNR